MSKKSIVVILIAFSLLLTGGCSPKDTGNTIIETHINLPENMDYISDFQAFDNNNIYIAGGSRKDEKEVYSVIWRSEDQGESWKMIFKKQFKGENGYMEPLINIISKERFIIEVNEWDIEEKKAIITTCYYVDNINDPVLEPKFNNNDKNGLVGNAQFVDEYTAYEIEYDHENICCKMYELNIKEESISELDLPDNIFPYEYVAYKDCVYLLCDDGAFVYSIQNGNFVENSNLGSENIKGLNCKHGKKGEMYILNDEGSNRCNYFIGKTEIVKICGDKKMVFKTDNTETFNLNSTIFFTSLCSTNDIYVCYQYKEQLFASRIILK